MEAKKPIVKVEEAVSKVSTTLVKVTRRRDGDMSDVYACCIGTDGELVSTLIPLDTEVELDNNIILSLKGRTEMVRKSAKEGGETLVADPTYLIEKL